MSDERLCVTCPVLHPARPPEHYRDPYVCGGDRRRLARELAELPGLVDALPLAFPRLPRPQLNGSRIRSTPVASEPIAWTPYDLALPANPRTRALLARGVLGLDPDQIGDLSVATVLDTWVRDWADIRAEHHPVPTVTSLCRWLSFRLDWACTEHPAIDEFAAELVELARCVRTASGLYSSSSTYVGDCPAVLRDGSRCGRPLRVDMCARTEDGQDASFLIQCRCGSTWDRTKSEWITLAAAQQAAGLARWQKGKASA